jgi:hypothetical protein
MRLEGLRKRLEGTYDLDKVEDCQRVIQVLLRGSDSANVTLSRAREELKALALDVVNDRIEAKERAAEVLTAKDGSEELRPRGPEPLMGFLSKMADEMVRAEEMTDEDLKSEVLNGLWANLDMHSRDSAVLSELMRRFGGEQEADSSD